MSTIPFESGVCYHLYNRGNNKENIFRDDKNYAYFLTKIKHYLLPVCHIYAYCLMPNHFHLVLQIKSIEDLPEEYSNGKKKLHQPFSNLFNAYAKTINKIYGRTGSLFQEHLHRIEIDSADYLQDLIIYVHLNPAKHGFSDSFTSYSHSSYKALVSDKPTLLGRNFVIDLFGNSENFKYCHEMQLYRNKEKMSELNEI